MEATVNWVDVEERLPTEDTYYIVCVPTVLGKKFVTEAGFDKEGNWYYDEYNTVPLVSHWAENIQLP